MNRSSGFPVRTTAPRERSPSSEPNRSPSSATISRFMKLKGGLSNPTMRTRPSRSVSNVRGIAPPFSFCSLGPEHRPQRVGDPPRDPLVKLDVEAPVDGYLDQGLVLPGG